MLVKQQKINKLPPPFCPDAYTIIKIKGSMITAKANKTGTMITRNSFASKWLLNQLHKLGYSISSSEVLRYKQSAIESTTLEPVESSENNFYQWVADNVDHNLVTLTGKGMFHGMGVISISATNTSNATVIKRLKERRKSEDFVRNRDIPVENYLRESYNGL